MILGRVTGSLQTTIISPGLERLKLLFVQPEKSDGKPSGDAFVACDSTMQAGIGDLVFVVEAKEAVFALPDGDGPADAAIVGIVDPTEGE